MAWTTLTLLYCGMKSFIRKTDKSLKVKRKMNVFNPKFSCDMALIQMIPKKRKKHRKGMSEKLLAEAFSLFSCQNLSSQTT